MSFNQQHGSTNIDELVALGLDQADIIDFSSNCCPYSIYDDIPRPDTELITRYPDIGNCVLRQKLSHLAAAHETEIAIGNGTSELIWALPRAFLRAGDRVLVLGPTFSEYANASEIVGARVHTLMPEHVFAFDANAIISTIDTIQPRLVFICNPNNPTGTVLSHGNLENIYHRVRAYGGLLVIDEAYRNFADIPQYQMPRAQSIVLRSLTKDGAIPGLRLGYCIADEVNTQAIERQLPPWNVNALAQYYGAAIIDRFDEVLANVERSRADSIALQAAMAQNGWDIMPTQTHYFLARVANAGKVRRHLLIKHGINVRDCTSFRLERYIRLSPQRECNNAQLKKITFNSVNS